MKSGISGIGYLNTILLDPEFVPIQKAWLLGIFSIDTCNKLWYTILRVRVFNAVSSLDPQTINKEQTVM
jgi:hypothetical protein